MPVPLDRRLLMRVNRHHTLCLIPLSLLALSTTANAQQSTSEGEDESEDAFAGADPFSEMSGPSVGTESGAAVTDGENEARLETEGETFAPLVMTGVVQEMHISYISFVRRTPRSGWVAAHGGSFQCAKAFNEHLVWELHLGGAGGPSGPYDGPYQHVFFRVATGPRVVYGFGRGFQVSASAALTYLGYGRHLRDTGDNREDIIAFGAEAGVSFSYTPWRVFQTGSAGLYIDARYQAGYGTEGFEHGTIFAAGIAFVHRALSGHLE